ncbi:hypothetical protein DICPUDRAFT_58166 [Dictyostelium purpureum]|uniref:Follistatin-like domain-containing protein n=1 Tax=Dictyostelium purpureum TaxID=5786 RepID=F0ZZH5_DICPU|nr:uncharacterized protein DICPUDRAFT_58166 [Dictyostelium purpureum]EGC30654.1 hypothetical protein DICPUDRAFT_58166 [Dictyostelium purpureum]|eukprot:XP_003292819.1 hypothetical protein DICPUDRAFT_58166 [Dictyostelium purpureum]
MKILIILLIIIQLINNATVAYNYNSRQNKNNNSFKYYHYPHFNQHFSFSPTSSLNNSYSNNINHDSKCKVLSKSITIYDDYLNSDYINLSNNDINRGYLESFTLENQIPTFSNSRYSIKINNTFSINDKIQFISPHNLFNSKNVKELNFKIYLPNKITTKINIQLINSINNFCGERIPILYTIEDNFKGSPPYQQWLNGRVLLKKEDANFYNGFRIFTDSISINNEWIDEFYLDNFKLIYNNYSNNNSKCIDSYKNNQNININHIYNNHQEFFENKINRKILELNLENNDNNNILVNKYFLKLSNKDILLGGKNGDFSVYSNDFYGKEEKWEFENNSFLEEYSNGNIVLKGIIINRNNLCNKWKVNLEFLPISNKQISVHSRKELSSFSYVENGGNIDSSKWSYYRLVNNEISYWEGLECNENRFYTFSNPQPNILTTQVGFGANNKNSNFGLSTTLFLHQNILIEINIDLQESPIQNTNTNINYNTCEYLQCPNGFKCFLNNQTGERECKLMAYHIDDKDDQSCSSLICPNGYSCSYEKETNIKSCIKDIGPFNKDDCSVVECPKGYGCWFNSTDETLNCKEIGEENHCSDFKCPHNQHCVYEQSQRKCAPIINNDYTCKNVKCPHNHQCQINSNGLPRCYPIIDPCKYKNCRPGKECRVTPCGEAKCFYPEECCEGKYCPPGYKCVKYNGIDECIGLPPPIIVNNCDDISCPINFTCIDINKGTGNFTPFCVPTEGSCQSYTTTFDIEGFIWIDKNGDGIKNKYEHEFGTNLFIRLLNNIDNTPARNTFGNIIPISVTDEKGHFIFSDVLPGTYVINFGKIKGFHWAKTDNSWVNLDGYSPPLELPHYSPGDTRFLLDGTPVTSKYLSKKVIFPSPTVKDYNKMLSIHERNNNALTPLPENLLGIPTNVCPTHFVVGGIFAGLVPKNPHPSPTPSPTPSSTTTSPTTPPTPTPSHNENGLFAIGKRIFFDYNNNGVFDQNDIGASNVMVTLLNQDGSPAKYNKGNMVQQVTTDSKGYYFFDSLPSGDYMVQLGNLPQSFSLSPYNNYPLSKDENISKIFNLKKDSKGVVLGELGVYPRSIFAQYIRPDVDFALVSDLPLFAVGDTVFYDQNKNGIQDSNEKGIMGIPVKLTSKTTNKSYTTVTDSDGHYLFDNVQEGSYFLSFKLPNGYSTTNSFATLSRGEYKTQPFTLDKKLPPTSSKKPYKPITAPRFDDTKDLPLFFPNSFGIGHVTFIDSNMDGVFTYGTDKPLPGVKVSLLNSNNPKEPVTNVFGQVVESVSSNVNGIYYIDNLKPGVYRVNFEPPKGYRLTNLPKSFLSLPDMGSLALPESSQTNPLDIEKVSKSTSTAYKQMGVNAAKMFIGANAGYFVPPTISVGTFVWYDKNFNGIYDQNEQGAQGITIALYDSKGNQAIDINGNLVAPLQTDSNGYYLFTKIPEGSYYVAFKNIPNGLRLTDQRVLSGLSSAIDSAPNPNTGFTNIFKISVDDPKVRQTLPEDNSPDFYINDIENAGLILGNQARPNRYAVGRYVYYDDNRNGLLDDGEGGVENIKVQILSLNGQPALDYRGKPIPAVYTDSSGKYIIDNLAEGSYQLHFSNLPNTYNFENLPSPYPSFLNGKTGIFTLSPKVTVQTSKLKKSKKFLLMENDVSSDANNVATAIADIFNPLTGSNTNPNGGSTSIEGNKSSEHQSSSSSSTASSSSSSSSFVGVPVDQSLEEFPIDQYSPFLESIEGTTPLDAIEANRTDLTRNAALVRSPAYAFGQIVFYLDAKGEQIGVPGVTVTLKDSSGDPVTSIQGKPLDPTKTDSKGQYRFNQLRAGTYHVEFSNIPPGFTFYDPITGVIDFDLVNLNKDVRGTLPADKVPRSVYYNPKINLQLVPPYFFAIGNQVWNDTNKDGLYQIGEPFIPNVTVILASGNGDYVLDHFSQPVLPTRTDLNGEYFFDYLPEGFYTVQFEAPSRHYFTNQLVPIDKSDPNSFNSYPNSQGLTGKIELSASKYLEAPPSKYKSIIKALVVNFHIDAGIVYDVHYVQSYAVGRYVFKDSNDNGIMDSDEKGVSGVQVDIYTPNGESVKNLDGKIVKPTVTDENGFYKFDMLTSGTYVIKFSQIPKDLMFGNKTLPDPNTGVTPSFSLFPAIPNVRLSTPDDGVLAQAVDFNKNAGLIDAVSFAMGHYVWFDINLNGIMDEDEPPATEFTIVLYKCNITDIDVDCNVDYNNFTSTDEKGFYYFDKLDPGVYKLYFWNALKTYQVTTPNQGDGTNDSKAVNDIIDSIFLNIFNPDVTLTNPNLDGVVQAQYIDRNLNIGLMKPSMFSVGYKVWYDTNRNGIIDQKELPVENVTVSLRHLKSKTKDYSFDIYGNPLVAITNSTGHYWINNVLPGFYVAKFSNLPDDTRFTVQLNDNVANAYGLTGTINLFYNSSKVHPYNPYIDIGSENADYVYAKVNAGILKGKTDIYLYSVSGYVYYDVNKNGIKDPNEDTVNGTRVTLLDLNGGPMIDADSSQIQPYITGPDGYYKFDGFLKGEYQISFEGVPSVKYQFYSPLDQQHLNHSVLDKVVVSLPENKNVVNVTDDKVNAVFILRQQNAGIIKLITYAIGRRVIPNYYNTTLQDSGFKGGGISVSLYRNNAVATYVDGTPIQPTITDNNGYYYFDNVPILEGYQVMFYNLPDGWMFEKFKNSLNPFISFETLQTFNLPRSRPIPINKTEYPNLDATYGCLDQNTYIAPILFGIGDVTFVDVEGSGIQAVPKIPLPGVTVKLLTSDYKPAVNAFGITVESQITGQFGTYKFMDLYHGRYIVHFSLVKGYSYTQPFSGEDVTLDSNVNPVDGYTNVIDLDVNDPSIIMIPLETRNLTLVCDTSVDAGYVSLSPKGYISGMTYIDYNANYKFGSYDKPVQGITVSLYTGDNSELVATTKTDKNGFYSFSDLFISSQYQVVFSGIPPGYYPLGDTVQFPVASKTGVNLGIIYPTDFCQDEIKIFISCFVKGDTNKDVPVAVSFPYGSFSDLNNDYGDKEEILTLSDTRTIYGVGYDRKQNYLYVSPYKKQFASISPQTASSIFRKNLSTGQVSVYTDLAKIFGFDFLAPQGRTSGDSLTYRILFGDLDIVGDYIWVTNLYRNIVVKIPLRETPTKDNIKLINITHDCGENGPWRIFGLGWDGNNMFVGGVCECSESFNQSALVGVIKKINNDEKTTTDALVIPLNYPRGRLQTRIMYLSDQTPIFSSVQNSTWVPWNDTAGNFKPQAQITDITFTGNGGGGNMIISFKDREGDSQSVTPAGDMLIACKDSSGQYVLESAGVCGGLIGANPIAIGNMVPQGPGGGEFFDDNFGNRDWQHDETSWGSAFYLPGSGELIGGSYDLFSTNEAVLKHWSLQNGRVLGGFILIHGAGLDFVFNKVNGLGDIDSNCGLPNTYIGNYVWLDQNQNGLQDPNEKGIANITIQLFDTNNTLVNMTRTNENGIYQFQVHSGFRYRVHFVLPPTYRFTISVINQADARQVEEINSQVDEKGDYYFYADGEGQNNLDIDCGLIRG